MAEHSLVPHRSRGVAWQVLDGELVLLRAIDNELLGLNEVGRRVWELSDGTRSIGQIVEALIVEFHVPARQAAADTCQFNDDLVAIRALEFHAAAAD